MKRIISRIVTLLTAVALCITPTVGVYAAEATTESQTDSAIVVPDSVTADDGWSSGSFYIYRTTGNKYFSKGTLSISLSSSNSGYSGSYTVELQTSLGAFVGKLSAPCNGTTTLNFNVPSGGWYRLYMRTDDNCTTPQNYTILNIRVL